MTKVFLERKIEEVLLNYEPRIDLKMLELMMTKIIID